jgi:hypothetical protein
VRVILACAGSQAKWRGYLNGIPSHLAPVPPDGTPLLLRTVAQVRQFTTDINVTAPDGDWRYKLPGTTHHVRGEGEPSEYASTRALWNERGRTVLLLGDVYWTDEAIGRVLTEPADDFRVFGRFGPSKVTGTPYGEMFAASWTPAQHAALDRHLEVVHATRAAGTVTRPPGWMLLRSWQGTPLNKHRVKRPPFVDIDDWTDDVDKPEDFERHPAFGGACAGG